MSLRYGRLFDATVKAEYERALTAAKAHLRSLPAEPPAGRTLLPVLADDWKEAPAVKARLAGGFCVRAQVQGPCAYANICEHCPNFRTDAGYLPVLAAQRTDVETLARAAEAACAALLAAGQPVTFDEVATRAGLGRATLYRNPDLRAIVEEHRTHAREAHTLTGLTTEIEHLRIALEALAAKVRRHEEQLRRLHHHQRTGS